MDFRTKIDNDAVFEPEVTASMAGAVEDVCLALNVNDNVREWEILATRIIDLVRSGEWDCARLGDRVLRRADWATDVLGSTL